MNLIYKVFRIDPDSREGVIAATSGLGIVVNILVAAAKVIVGTLASSIAIVSEGVNNATDALTSVLTLVGTKLAGKHPESIMNEAKSISAKTVIDAAKAGDPAAVEVFDRYTYYLAVGLVNIINFIDPEIIAIGGGVSAAGEFLIKPVREKLSKLVFYKSMPYARIELATLGNDAGIIGAAMLGR